MSKLYRNRIVHNLFGHPAREIAYLVALPFIGKERAYELAGKVHDLTIPKREGKK